ncbi:MAG: XRE family transcriptional regulator [Oscillospiraceae bacterium]
MPFTDRLKSLRVAAGYSQKKLAETMHVTQQAVGKWETGRSSPDLPSVNLLAKLFNVTTDYILGNDAQTTDDTVIQSQVMVPVVGTVKAGFGAYALQEDYGEEPANVKNPNEYFYLIVHGDSMQPRIQDGDLALVHKQSTLEDGDLGVFIYGENEGTLKKYIRKNNTVILQPFNPAYQPQIVTGNELENLYIAGKVKETKAKW